MSNWLPVQKRRDVVTLLMAGFSVRETARSVGCSKVTVGQYRKLIAAAEHCGLDDARLPKCSCGLPSGHKGWCSFRVSKSAARQKFLDRWKGKQHGKEHEAYKQGPS